MNRHRLVPLVLALGLLPASCGGEDGGADAADALPTGGCGVADPETGAAVFCSAAGYEMCVCATGRCARIDLTCPSEYRYADGAGACVPTDELTTLVDSRSGSDFCPTLDADADAGGDADTAADADAEAGASCGNGVVEPGEDCDGTTTRACTTACGSSGTSHCVACHWDACLPPIETCDGRDDNCDGLTDESFECAAYSTQTCTTSCATTGHRVCSETCSWEDCVPPAEVCDGADNDCDGVCDNGFPCCAGESGDCTTLCGTVGTRACTAACVWQECVPPLETCNGLDDDCDGMTDDVADAFACGDGCCNGDETYCSCPEDCTTVVPPPAAPRPLWPWNGALTGTYRASLNLRPTFRWARATGGCGTATYDVQVDDSCSTPGFAGCTMLSPAASATGLAATSWQPGSDLPVATLVPVGRRYYWRVRACDGAAGCSAWSPVRYLDVGRVPSDFNGDGRSDLAVGAPGCLDGTSAGSGAVYVFDGGAAGLAGSYAQRLTPPTSQAAAHFGTTVAAGDFNADGFADLAVGAPERDSGSTDEGNVYVFLGSAAGLGTTAARTLDSPRGTAGASFGATLAVVGDANADGFADFAAGSPNETVTSASHAGRVELYLGGTVLPLSPAVSLAAPVPQPLAYFGQALSGAGDLFGDGHAGLMVGVPGQIATTANAGAVLLYRGSGTGLATTPAGTLTCPGDLAGAQFGAAVACMGDLGEDGYPDLAVGAPSYSAGAVGEGNVFTYQVDALGLPTAPVRTLDSPSNQANANFGAALAPLGRVGPSSIPGLAVGAPRQDGIVAAAGAVFVYFGSGSLSPTPTTEAAPDAEGNAGFGETVGGVLDFDGDGAPDLAVGAPRHDGTNTDEGTAYAYYGPTGFAGWPSSPGRTLTDPVPAAGDTFGSAASGGGF